jgi:MerR family copper efflux transcriptional regulator
VTTGYQIKDVAERSGFTAATLRYYEDIGLLPPSGRSPAGYRLYDDRVLDRLAFISRAKQLGCTLDEIADLSLAWDGGQCGPVQDRLSAVVAEKLATSEQQILELVTLRDELHRAAAALERHRPEGPCDDRCGCVSDSRLDAPSEPGAVTLTTKPITAVAVDIACTLAPQLMKGRLDEWQQLLIHVVRRDRTEAGVRLTFASGAPLDDLVRLTAAEQDCCQFFHFAITIDSRGVALEVGAPREGLPVLHALFGAPA